jgi:2',3'-cyclic-nucleotide 2'-phosphodiesterase (5'-nucleotidase family)
MVADRWRESLLSWQELERLGYTAVTLGELELRQWALTDSLLRAGSKLPLVTTNIERRVGDDDWKPVGARYLTVDVDGVRVGFISVIAEGRTSDYALQQTKGVLRILPALETTREVAHLLKGTGAGPSSRILAKDEAKRMARDRVDLLVLLGYLDKQGTQTFADSIPEIDLILGGLHQAPDASPVKLGHAIVNRSGDRGVTVAVTDVVISPRNEISEFSGRTVVLEESFPEDPQVEALAEAATGASEQDRAIRRDRKRKERMENMENMEKLRLEHEGQPAGLAEPSADPAAPPRSGIEPFAPASGDSAGRTPVMGR